MILNSKQLFKEYFNKHYKKLSSDYVQTINYEQFKNKVFIVACCFETDISVFENIINQNHIDVNYQDPIGNNGFILACRFNCLKIVKYIATNLIINTHHINTYDNNAVLSACYKNPNTDVIKYLINDLKINIWHKNQYDNNGFLSACKGNKNIKIMKFLIKKLKITNNNFGKQGLFISFRNENYKIFKFLFNNLKFNLDSIDWNSLMRLCELHYGGNIFMYLIEQIRIDINYVRYWYTYTSKLKQYKYYSDYKNSGVIQNKLNLLNYIY